MGVTFSVNRSLQNTGGMLEPASIVNVRPTNAVRLK